MVKLRIIRSGPTENTYVKDMVGTCTHYCHKDEAKEFKSKEAAIIWLTQQGESLYPGGIHEMDTEAA